MSIWRGQFAIRKAHDGRGYIVTHDGIVIKFCWTFWGAERAMAKAKAAHEWNKRRAVATEVGTHGNEGHRPP